MNCLHLSDFTNVAEVTRNKDCLEPTVADETAGIHVLFYF